MATILWERQRIIIKTVDIWTFFKSHFNAMFLENAPNTT